MHTDAIAAVYDAEGPFASVYVDVREDVEDGAHQRDLRVDDALRRLTTAGTPQRTVDLIADRLRAHPGMSPPVTRALVAAGDDVLLDETLPVQLPDAVVTFGWLPELTEWVRLHEPIVPFGVVQADRKGSRTTVHRSSTGDHSGDEVTDVEGEALHITKVGSGGLAQRRMQRHAEEVWHHNAKETAEHIQRLAAEGFGLVILSGDVRARAEIRGLLDQRAMNVLVETEVGGRASGASDTALDTQTHRLVEEHVTAARLSLAHEVQQRRSKGAGAASGYADVLAAMVQGQVETLLLDPEQTGEQWLRPADFGGLDLAVPTGEAVGLGQALLASAARTSADVSLVPAVAMDGAESAALLRWDGFPRT